MRHASALSFLLALATAAGLAQVSPNLPVPLHFQEHSKWCWVAASQMVLNYRGFPWSQCEIVNRAKGFAHACGAPDSFNWADPANTGASLQEVQGVFTTLGPGAELLTRPLNPGQIAALTQSGVPVLLAWTWRQGGAHMAVITGIDGAGSGALLSINDPWPGMGYRQRTYGSTLSAPDRDWTVTYLTR